MVTPWVETKAWIQLLLEGRTLRRAMSLAAPTDTGPEAMEVTCQYSNASIELLLTPGWWSSTSPSACSIPTRRTAKPQAGPRTDATVAQNPALFWTPTSARRAGWSLFLRSFVLIG